MKYEHRPSKKISAVTLAGALATITAWIIEVTTALVVPAPVVAAFTVVFVVICGYLVRETP